MELRDPLPQEEEGEPEVRGTGETGLGCRAQNEKKLGYTVWGHWVGLRDRHPSLGTQSRWPDHDSVTMSHFLP